MKAFEIHTFQDGKWKIDSVFDDRELAMFEARRVDEGTRYSGVRVIEEVYDEATDLTTTRTIFSRWKRRSAGAGAKSGGRKKSGSTTESRGPRAHSKAKTQAKRKIHQLSCSNSYSRRSCLCRPVGASGFAATLPASLTASSRCYCRARRLSFLPG